MGERGWVSDTITRAAATNVDLHKAVEQGRFRRDFLDRLEVLTPQLPTLRERVEDFALLMEHFFEVANEEEGTDVGPPAPTDARRLARECGHTVESQRHRRRAAGSRLQRSRPVARACAGNETHCHSRSS